MKTIKTALTAFAVLGVAYAFSAIPLPEHPRPDWERAEWVNLNGEWDFAFEAKGTPVDAPARPAQFDQKIVVPFGWAAPLSGVKGEGDSAWYRREVEIPADWKSPRFFLVVGASDWQTDVFVNGKFVDRHQGGYVPFEVELTPFAKKGGKATVELRVWDAPASISGKDWRLYGKQAYGNARGVWQTVYLEARGPEYLETIHFTPHIENGGVSAEVTLGEPARKPLAVQIVFKAADRADPVVVAFAPGQSKAWVDIPLDVVHLWELDDPYLYEVRAVLLGEGVTDAVSTYFGMRQVGVGKLPGTGYPYVTLNGRPIYLQLSS